MKGFLLYSFLAMYLTTAFAEGILQTFYQGKSRRVCGLFSPLFGSVKSIGSEYVDSLLSPGGIDIQDERVWLVENYLPTCSGTMLYIGVGSYTVHYPYYTQTPSLFETIDYLEERAQFGSPFKHHVADILLFQPKHLYDHVSFFGILGYPVKKYAPFTTNESIHEVLEKIHTLVKEGGVLQIGANYYDHEPYTIDFWTQKFAEQYAKKYEVISMGRSPLSIIWVGKKIRN